MDRPIHLDVRRRCRRLSTRIQELLNGSRALSGAAAAVLALALAWTAESSSRKQGVSAWLQTHPPSDEFLQSALRSHQLERLVDSAAIDRIWRNLPTNASNAPYVWASDDSAYVIFFLPSPTEEALFEPHLYRRASNAAPLPDQKSWRRLGTGWEGWNALEARLQTVQKQPPPPRHKKAPSDPRALRF